MRASQFWQRMPKWQPPTKPQTVAEAIAELDRAGMLQIALLCACAADPTRSLAARRLAAAQIASAQVVRHG